MDKERILAIIKRTANEYNWSLDTALENLKQIGFCIDNVEGNARFTESHVKMSVDFAYIAFQ